MAICPFSMDGALYCDVALVQQEVEHIELAGKTAVVIDVLRATSTLTVVLANGALRVYPTASVEEARALKTQDPHRLLCGERGGTRLPGFDLGNSPQEYKPEVVRGRELVMTTTNGTRAIVSTEQADTVLLASFLNLPAVVDTCRRLGRDVVVVCAGTERRFTLEDAVCAGMICSELTGFSPDDWTGGARPVFDGAVTALLLQRHWQGRILDMLRFSRHGRRLIDLGFESDLEICGQVGAYSVVPVYRGGVIELGYTA